MRFQEITLHNVGVYQGRQVIDLSSTSVDKPVLLFGGLNGGGKTTFLEAIQLALYGKLAQTARRGSRAYEDYLLELTNRAVSPEEGAAITLVFEESEGSERHEYTLVRTWRVKGKGFRESVEVYVDGGYSPALSENWEEEVERFLPQRLCNLFFFDGEQIEALAEPSRTTSILRTAISSLLGLELVDQLQADLTAVERKKRRQNASPGSDDEIRRLEEQRAAAMQRLEFLQSDSIAKHADLQAAKQRLSKAEADFEARGGSLFERSQDLEKQKTELELRLRSHEGDLRELASGVLPLALVKDQLVALQGKAESDSEARSASVAVQLLSASDAALLEDLKSKIHDHKVINTLESSLAARREGLHETAGNKASGLALDEPAKDQLNGLLQGERLDKSIGKVEQVKQDLDELSEALTKIEREIARIPDEGALHDIIEARADAKVKLEYAEAQYQESKNAWESCRQGLDTLDEQLAKTYENIELNSQRDELDGRIVDRAVQIREVMTSFKKRVLEKHVARLESLILESYQCLLRKTGLIRGVEIDPDSLTLNLRGIHGEVVQPRHLSAGERQLLATSILWGLAKASGRSLPIVIDTPLGRLDSSHRTNLVENYFPNASHQVILLSTDEEIDGRYLKKLKPHLAACYELSYDDETGGTNVVEGYFEETAA
ncbi:DNA sulfur modification protein DndD [Natronospira proteinivora]|uniref:DNA sulfur modification protein DndD n=1 Tax=Natronospira proteinivora TaxID=1807133 RepID=A0ABT1G8H9_9GAMM|nr:DNA sulfur modification protein DndD [Natronospira proteinivora]MCP1727610.1 DNA sulfur modification protein DndD [Natronospira proteinivora]